MCGRYDNLIAREAYRGLYKACQALWESGSR